MRIGKLISGVLLSVCIFICTATVVLQAQDPFSFPGAVSFRDRETEVKPGSLTSNVVRVINTTGRSGEFAVRINVPAGWQVVGSRERTLSMRAGDTLFLPVRVIALSRIQRDESQIINASLLQFGNVIANDNWSVHPVLNSDWSATVSQTRIILPSHVDSTSFSLHVSNTGDLPEIFTLEMRPGMGVKIINARGEILQEPELGFRLDPLQDTTLIIRARFTEEDIIASRIPENGKLPARVRLALTSEPHAIRGGRSWRANIDLKRLESAWKTHPSKFYTVPVTLDFNAYNVLGENAYGDLSLYGYHRFGNEMSLSYYFQSSFVSNYLNPQAFLGQYLQINFTSRFLDVSIGNVSHAIEGASISGEGARVTGKYQGHTVSATYTQSPEIFSDSPNIRGFAGEYRYSQGNLRGGAFVQLRENFFQRTEDEIAGAQVSYRFLTNQMIRTGFSASRQTHSWNPDSIFTTSGTGFTVNYSGSYSRLSYNLLYSENSPAHVIRRGNESLTSRLSWRFNPTHNVYAAWSKTTTDPELYYRGELREFNAFRSREIYRVGYQYRGSLSDISFQPIHQRLTDPFLAYTFSGTELSYRVNDLYGFRFFSTAIAGYTNFPDLGSDPFFVAHLRAGIRYFQYALNLRYYYGAFYSNELRRFAELGVNTNRFGASLDFDNPFLNQMFLLRVSSLYNYSTYNEQHSASLRPELFYFPQQDLRLGVYARYYGLSSMQESITGLPEIDLEGGGYSSSRFEFGFSIRKDLNMPVSGRRFYDLTIVVYRDLSGTGTKQSSDPGLRDMWVRIQLLEQAEGEDSRFVSQGDIYETLTGRDGKALFMNVKPGNYLVTIIPVGEAVSRHEARTYEILVTTSKTVYLTVDRGARVAGSIILDRDQYTRAEYFPVNAIRITATNEEGQQFTTLTNEAGQYNLYLPRGRYTISVNENIFRDIFDLQQNNVPVEIIHDQEIVTVNFVARERARQIRIQQPQQNNNNINEE